MFDRYVTAVEAALGELIAHCNEVMEPSAERVESLCRAEHSLHMVREAEPDLRTCDAVQGAIDAMNRMAEAETKDALRVYVAFEDAIERIEALVHHAKYEVDEPVDV